LSARRVERFQDVEVVPFYTKDGSHCSDSEVLVLALLLARPAAVADASKWARDVLEDCSGYVAGEPWTVPATWSGTRSTLVVKKFEALLAKLEQKEKQGAALAAASFDGAGRTPGPLTEQRIMDYLFGLMAKRGAARALYGLGFKKDPPLRKTYILPRVAKLVHEQEHTLAAQMVESIGSALDESSAAVPGKSSRSPTKGKLKRVLADKENEISELNAFHEQETEQLTDELSTEVCE
jgi:hypothetical protein